MDYDVSIRVMIEFISSYPIVIPLTKIRDPPFPFWLLHTTFERVKLEDDVLETMLYGDRIVPVWKKTFLDAIGMPENPTGFKFQEPTPEEF